MRGMLSCVLVSKYERRPFLETLCMCKVFSNHWTDNSYYFGSLLHHKIIKLAKHIQILNKASRIHGLFQFTVCFSSSVCVS